MVFTYDDYRQAASVLWGAASRFAIDEQRRLNWRYFGGALAPLPVVIGLTAYGRCLGMTRAKEGHQWAASVPRITLASNLFADGTTAVRDTLLHEMVHAKLMLAGLDHAHNGWPWCEEIMRLSPLHLGRSVAAAPVHPRPINGKNVRLAREGYLARKDLATWPDSLRTSPVARGRILRVPMF
jgi:hypothetical protein